MTILEAMAEAVRIAKSEDKLVYLCESQNTYQFLLRWQRGWLFKAWPGGRKVLSMRGKRLVDDAQETAFLR